MKPQEPRAAFTLIEVLVVMAILGLLVGLLIPAVQAARGAARRADCLDRLRQLGLGLNSHLAAQGRFPAAFWPGAVSPANPYYRSGNLSVHCQLLPYLEQRVAYDQLNLTAGSPATTWENTTVGTAVLPVFLCPADSTRIAGGTSFRACIGPYPSEFDSPRSGNGAFPSYDRLGPSDFTDGLSQTVGFAERVRGSGAGPNQAADRFQDVWYSHLFSLGGPRTTDEMMASCGALEGTPAETYLKAGASWLVAGLEWTLYNHVAPPNWSGMDCGAEGAPLTPNNFSTIGAFSARSQHPGGVHVLLMDGSSRFVRETVNLATWRALASRASGEVISDDSN